jgi:hypothetical protein
VNRALPPGEESLMGLRALKGCLLAVSRRFVRLAVLFALALATQRGALGRHDWPTVAQKQKSPPSLCRAGHEEGF